MKGRALTVCDLSRKQLDFLKECLFEEQDAEEVFKDITPEEIPDEFIYDHYADCTFTEEDFE